MYYDMFYKALISSFRFFPNQTDMKLVAEIKTHALFALG